MPVAPEHAGGGPVYFAWVGPTETTFGPEHVRYDEYIRRFDITLEEGKLPLASIDIKNPGALLADGRERWAWFAFDDDAGVRQAFFGAIVGIPSDLFDSIITVQLIAKPLDYLARKQAVAETLKADPDFYNQYLVDPKYWDDPDTILEARSANWHHDPVSHAVTISDLLVGEDGEQEFFGADVIRGSVQFTIGEAPKGAVAMDLSVVWTQTATGIVDLGHKLFGSYTATSILDSWPKTLETFDGGWSVEGSAAIDVFNTFSTQAVSYQYSWQNPQKEHINGDAMSVTENYNGPPPGIFGKEINYKRTESFVIGDPETGRAASTSIQETSTIVLGVSSPWSGPSCRCAITPSATAPSMCALR
ncbi:hypothetical protein [Bradyrhizobium sp. RDM4]|uniref:hypothetical protein n=1 Tax=Bradyrhizobium sp. RDM4 TaxID=3378765 RepID=UPI0038FCBE29